MSSETVEPGVARREGCAHHIPACRRVSIAEVARAVYAAPSCLPGWHMHRTHGAASFRTGRILGKGTVRDLGSWWAAWLLRISPHRWPRADRTRVSATAWRPGPPRARPQGDLLEVDEALGAGDWWRVTNPGRLERRGHPKLSHQDYRYQGSLQFWPSENALGTLSSPQIFCPARRGWRAKWPFLAAKCRSMASFAASTDG